MEEMAESQTKQAQTNETTAQDFSLELYEDIPSNPVGGEIIIHSSSSHLNLLDMFKIFVPSTSQDVQSDKDDLPSAKTLIDHIISRVYKLSQSVNDMEIKSYAHRVMFDNFEAQVLKELINIETQLRLSNFYYSIKTRDVHMYKEISSQITQVKIHMDARFNLLQSTIMASCKKFYSICNEIIPKLGKR